MQNTPVTDNDNVSIIIPAFNEASAIQKTIIDLLIIAKNENWEVIVVDDGSTDDTVEILKKISGIRVINHPYNKGYGAALKTGILHAKGNVVVFFDADNQHDPQDIKKLLDNFQNCDMLVGQRGKDSHREWIRKPGKWILSKVANYLTERKIPDINSGFRVIKKDIIRKLLHLFPDGFSFSTTSTIAFMNMGYNVGYFPIKVAKRIGKSNVKQLKHGSSTLLLIIRLIVLFNPLKVFMPASLVMLSLGIIYEVIFGIILVPGIKLLPGSILFFISSILLFFFGLVVDQVSEMRKYLNNK
jgi:glycosyltransferase involved in cell wall biosynthesis